MRNTRGFQLKVNSTWLELLKPDLLPAVIWHLVSTSSIPHPSIFSFTPPTWRLWVVIRPRRPVPEPGSCPSSSPPLSASPRFTCCTRTSPRTADTPDFTLSRWRTRKEEASHWRNTGGKWVSLASKSACRLLLRYCRSVLGCFCTFNTKSKCFHPARAHTLLPSLQPRSQLAYTSESLNWSDSESIKAGEL